MPINIHRTIVKSEIIKSVKDEYETLYIHLDKGIDNNEIIIIKNKGNVYNNYISDVRVSVNLTEDEKFTRNGLDIIYIIKISLKESLTGIEKIIKHLNNKSYKIISREGEVINNNTIKTLPRLGFERNGYFGNLLIKFSIDYNIKLNKNQIDSLKLIL